MKFSIEKKIKLLDFKLTKNLWASLFWVYKSRFAWSWMDFMKHKDYNFWDPIKSIDWKKAWKQDKLQTKVYEDERDLKVLFLIDNWNSINFSFDTKTNKKQIIEELFYSISMWASFNQDSIWVHIFWWEKEIFFDYQKWVHNIYKTIETLENNISQKNNKNKLSNIITKVYKEDFKNSLIFIITDDIDIIDNKEIKYLALKNEIIFIWVFDYFENNLTELDANISLKNNNSFLNISLSNKEKIKEYRLLRKDKIEKTKNYLAKNNISFKVFDTKNDIFKELYLLLNKEKIKNY